MDSDHNFFGYMTWAFLAEDTEKRLVGDPNVLFHISEWNEGDRLWIMDFVVIGGDARRRIQEAMALFPQCDQAKSLRRREDGSVRKITLWKRKRTLV